MRVDTTPAKIAMVQMRVDFARAQENLARAERAIAQAAASGCCCAVLPECCDIGWGLPDALSYADQIPGPRTQRLGRLAAQHGMYIVAGLTENDNGHCYNTAVIISPTGELLGKHRKINVLPGVEDMVYAVGDRLGVYDTDFGRVGIDICADNARSHLMLGHALAAMGAQMILSPCAWAVTANDAAQRTPYGAEWLESYGILAKEHGLWVVGVSNVGEVGAGVWAGWKCIGNSIAMSPDGVALTMEYGVDAEAVGVVSIAL